MIRISAACTLKQASQTFTRTAIELQLRVNVRQNTVPQHSARVLRYRRYTAPVNAREPLPTGTRLDCTVADSTKAVQNNSLPIVHVNV